MTPFRLKRVQVTELGLKVGRVKEIKISLNFSPILMDYCDPLVIESAWLFTREIHKRCVPTEDQSGSDHRTSKASKLQIPL